MVLFLSPKKQEIRINTKYNRSPLSSIKVESKVESKVELSIIIAPKQEIRINTNVHFTADFLLNEFVSSASINNSVTE